MAVTCGSGSAEGTLKPAATIAAVFKADPDAMSIVAVTAGGAASG